MRDYRNEWKKKWPSVLNPALYNIIMYKEVISHGNNFEIWNKITTNYKLLLIIFFFKKRQVYREFTY